MLVSFFEGVQPVGRTSALSLIFLTLSSVAFSQDVHRVRKVEGSVHRAVRSAEADRPGADAIRKMARPSRRIALRALTDSEAKPVSRKAGLVPSGISRELPEDSR